MEDRSSIRSGSLIKMILAAMMAAVFCVVAPISIPIGPVPITFMTLALYLTVYLIGWRYAILACVLYLVVGLVGFPVFSGFQGGLVKIAGPTGGYLIGYLPMLMLSGPIIEWTENKRRQLSPRLSRSSEEKQQARWIPVMQAAALLIGTLVLYTFGTIWFMVSTGTPVGAALELCVIPFIPGDLVKIVMAVALGPVVSQPVRSVGRNMVGRE